MRARGSASRATRSSALVDGGLQDLEQTRYATFDELRGYCEKVAGAVGVACIAVYGSDDVERAMTLGIALQLINIMRDVAEDAALGRVYLPQDELERFGVTRARARHARSGSRSWRSRRSARARISTRACACSTRSTGAARSASSTFAGLYRGQLDRMEANGFDVFGAVVPALDARRSSPSSRAGSLR